MFITDVKVKVPYDKMPKTLLTFRKSCFQFWSNWYIALNKSLTEFTAIIASTKSILLNGNSHFVSSSIYYKNKTLLEV